ncbi:MAG: CsgG/HfaB family protein, partial [Candidatus Hodarchaeota archaeon]
MKTSFILTLLIVFLLLPTSALNAQEANSTTPAENDQGKTAKDIQTVNSVTVAVIDFESQAPGNPDLGSQLGDILTGRLSIYDQFRLVERKKLEDLLKEHQLSLAGMVETNQAVKVGKMLSARIMVFGRAFTVDRDLYIVAKIVGTETSRVKGVIAKGNLESNLSEIIDQLVDNLVEGLEKWAPELLPKTEKLNNKIQVLKQQLKGKKLPSVAVMIPEVHINRLVTEPAAETEIKKIFKEVGFEIIEAKKQTLEKWAKDYSMAGVDIIITGAGFSEFGTRIGGLVGCVARLEVQATERESHRTITSERTTRRAVDLSEAVAAKTALQAAGRELAI